MAPPAAWQTPPSASGADLAKGGEIDRKVGTGTADLEPSTRGWQVLNARPESRS